jgi:hypothetical protein
MGAVAGLLAHPASQCSVLSTTISQPALAPSSDSSAGPSLPCFPLLLPLLQVHMLGSDAAVVAYTRLTQKMTPSGPVTVRAEVGAGVVWGLTTPKSS